MSFIKMGEDFAEAKEDELAPDGRYEVEIFRAGEDSYQSGQHYAEISFKFIGAEYPPFTTRLNIPPGEPLTLKDGSEQEPEKFKAMCRMQGRDWMRLVKQFDIEHDEDGVDTNDLVGKSAEAHVYRRRLPDGSREVQDIRLDRIPGEAKRSRKAADDEDDAEEPTQALSRRRRTRAA